MTRDTKLYSRKFDVRTPFNSQTLTTRVFQRSFFPKKLAQALIDYTQGDGKALFAVYQTFCNHVWFFHRWLFPELTKFSTQPTTQACVQLNANNFLSQKSFDAIVILHEKGLCKLTISCDGA